MARAKVLNHGLDMTTIDILWTSGRFPLDDDITATLPTTPTINAVYASDAGA